MKRIDDSNREAIKIVSKADNICSKKGKSKYEYVDSPEKIKGTCRHHLKRDDRPPFNGNGSYKKVTGPKAFARRNILELTLDNLKHITRPHVIDRISESIYLAFIEIDKRNESSEYSNTL